MAGKSQCLRHFGSLHHLRLQFPVVLVILGIQVGISVYLEAIDAISQLVDMSQEREFHPLLLTGNSHPILKVGSKLRGCQVGLVIPQLIHTSIHPPTTQCLLQILPQHFGLRIGMMDHVFIAFDGHLATFRQVAIAFDERV